MILVHWLSQVIQNTFTGKRLVGIFPVEMEFMFSKIYPESMSDSNITENNLMWLAGLMKLAVSKIWSSMAEEAANSDCFNKHSWKIHRGC